MSYQIIASTRLEDLLENQKDLFYPRWDSTAPRILIQNQSMETWIRLKLARTHGVSGALQFSFPDGLVREHLEILFEKYKGKILFLDDLRTILFFEIQKLSPLDFPFFKDSASEDAKMDSKRAYQLANVLAGLFHNYGVNGPAELLKALEDPRGRWNNEHFSWQSVLWKKLSDYAHPGQLINQIDENRSLPSEILRRPLVLMGSAFLSQRYWKYFRWLGEKAGVQITHLLLVPSPPLLKPNYRPLSLPWSGWCDFGRVSLAPLQGLPLKICAPQPSDGDGARTRLHQLQESLEQEKPMPLPPEAGGSDESLLIFNCYTARRELEVLKDQILGFLAENPHLRLGDIAVMAPDINLYAPWIGDLFDEGPRLHYHMIDLEAPQTSPFFQGLETLINLWEGNAFRSALFELFSNPCFQSARGITSEDRNLWLDFAHQTASYHLVDPAKTGYHTWKKGFERLWQGLALNSEAEPPFFPLSATATQGRSLGLLWKFLEDFKTFSLDVLEERTLTAWTTFVSQKVTEYLRDDDESPALERLFTQIYALQKTNDTLDWRGFLAFLKDQIQRRGGKKGKLLTDGIHFSSLKPLRALPFKVIALLGLGDMDFPQREDSPSFNLMKDSLGSKEMSPSSLDRYAFWETLMSAREALWFFYRGRSQESGDNVPPSSVLAELIRFTGEKPRETPLYGFQGAGETFVPRSYLWSQALHRSLEPHTEGANATVGDQEGILSHPYELEVTLKDWENLLINPLRQFFQRSLKISLPRQDYRELEDWENWDMEFTDRHEILMESLLNPKLEVEKAFEERLGKGLLRPGVFLEAEKTEMRGVLNSLGSAGWQLLKKQDFRSLSPEDLPPFLKVWNGAPFNPSHLVYGTSEEGLLVPVVQWAQEPSLGEKFQAALRVLTLQTCFSKPITYWFLPSGEPQTAAPSDPRVLQELWDAQTRFGQEAARTPLPFYMDLWKKALNSKSQAKVFNPEEMEDLWDSAIHDFQPSWSANLLKNCPYRSMAYPEDPDFVWLAERFNYWKDALFQPLLHLISPPKGKSQGDGHE